MINWLRKVFLWLKALFFKEETPLPAPPKETPKEENGENEIVEPTGRLKVLIGNLRLRRLPGLEGEVIGFATLFKIYAYTKTTEADGYRWYRVGSDEWLADDNEGSITLDTSAEAFHFPLQYIAVTEYYSGLHLGVDFGWNSSRGFPPDMPICAAFTATVVKVWDFYDAGLTVKLRYDDYDAKISWYAQYKHLSNADVSEGQVVKRGEKIGNMGGSGGYAPHLHFDLLKCPLGHEYEQSGGQREMYSYNPLEYLRAVRNENVLSFDEDAVRGVVWE